MNRLDPLVFAMDDPRLAPYRSVKQFPRALQAVEEGAVKLHRFPPGRWRVWTVIGANGDQWVVPDQPYCSCGHFHFRVVRGQDTTCYHLLAVEIAQALGRAEVIEAPEEEFFTFLRLLLRDLPAGTRSGKG